MRTLGIPSFGAPVGRAKGGRFVKLAPASEQPDRKPLHARLAHAKAQQPAHEQPVQIYRTTFAEMWRRLFS